MIPILFNSNENSFTTRGIGALSDALTCVVTEERNGIFEIEMMYPVDGIHFADIENRKIILANSNNFADAQPFRIYEISKPINGIVTVRGQHISYDLSRIPLRPFSASSAADAISKLSSKSAVTNPFTFWTDKDTQATMNVLNPISCRKLLGGVSGSFLDTFGGEWEFDRFTCKLHSTRGKNRGVTIRYGKNLTDVTQEENISACYAGIYPFWTNTDGDYVSLSEEIVYADNADTSLGVQPVDFSSDFDSAPSQSQLRAKAQSYIASNDISTPKVSVSCSFAQLAQTHEFKDLKLMEEVLLCDTVTVYFDRLGISTTAKVIKTVYDVLAERYTSVELGESRNSIASTVNEINEKIEESGRETISALKTAINRATSLISGNAGGYVVLHDSNGDSYPDEILIMNEPNLQTATKVWRWNKQGLGYSSTGYNGEFGLAMTSEGKIVADYITTGTLDASIVDVKHLKAENIDAGTIDAGIVKLATANAGLGVGTGSTIMGVGETGTTGAIVYGGATRPEDSIHYLIATNAGVRMSSVQNDGSYQYSIYCAESAVMSSGYRLEDGTPVTTASFSCGKNSLQATAPMRRLYNSNLFNYLMNAGVAMYNPTSVKANGHITSGNVYVVHGTWEPIAESGTKTHAGEAGDYLLLGYAGTYSLGMHDIRLRVYNGATSSFEDIELSSTAPFTVTANTGQTITNTVFGFYHDDGSGSRSFVMEAHSNSTEGTEGNRPNSYWYGKLMVIRLGVD